jgi:hypothetical protein
VLFTVLGYTSGLLDFNTGLQGLQGTYESLLQPMHDSEFALACLATLLLQGSVSIGLLGVKQTKVETAGRGMTQAEVHPPLAAWWSRCPQDQQVERWLAAWQDSVQQAVAAWTAPPVTWEDVHNLSDVLHHLDGYTADDGHTLFVSCHNRCVGQDPAVEDVRNTVVYNRWWYVLPQLVVLAHIPAECWWRVLHLS